MEKIKMTKIKESSENGGWTENGCKYFHRLSGWIQLKTNYNANKGNSLYCYVKDIYGNLSGSDKFDPKDGTLLDYFRFKGKNYALEQFLSLCTIWNPFGYYYLDKDNNKIFLQGFDSESYYKPLFIEFDSCGERVRIYQEV